MFRRDPQDIEALFTPVPPCEDGRVFNRNAWLQVQCFPPPPERLEAALAAFRAILALAAEEQLASEGEDWEGIKEKLNPLR